MADKQVVFTGQVTLPAIGQGTWYMGENAHCRGLKWRRCVLDWIWVYALLILQKCTLMVQRKR